MLIDLVNGGLSPNTAPNVHGVLGYARERGFDSRNSATGAAALLLALRTDDAIDVWLQATATDCVHSAGACRMRSRQRPGRSGRPRPGPLSASTTSTSMTRPSFQTSPRQHPRHGRRHRRAHGHHHAVLHPPAHLTTDRREGRTRSIGRGFWVLPDDYQLGRRTRPRGTNHPSARRAAARSWLTNLAELLD
jgi:hypothetical protein